MQLAQGAILDSRYRIVEQLGAGGMGLVFRAEDLRLSRPVAIKVLREELASRGDTPPRFEREAKALASLSHPHIVTVMDYGVTGGRPYLVMELLDGRTLRAVLDVEALDFERARSIVRQILEGLASAHDRGLAHRDLKPANVLLQALPTGRDHVKILDFGFAKFMEPQRSAERAPITRSGVGFGTPAYMSPEQAAGSPTDVRTDVYAMGALTFEVLTGRAPFQGELPELVRQHLSAPPPSLRDARPEAGFTPELDSLVQSAMAKQPDDRFADAGAMLRALDALPWPAGGPGTDTSPRARMEQAETLPADARAQPGYAEPDPAGVSTSGPEVRPRLPTRRRSRVGCAVLAFLAAGTGSLYVTRPGLVDSARSTMAELTGMVFGSSTAARAPVERSRVVRVRGDDGATTEAHTAPGDDADPWERGSLPRWVARARRYLYGGGRPSEAMLQRLRDYAKQHREDPRPSLLLAQAYTTRQWYSDAIERYELAHRIDPEARGDPRVLRNLITIVVEEPSVADRAGAAIETIYGAEAVDEIERALAAGDVKQAARRRLRLLQTRLNG